jgi:hypothetical protein
MLAWLGRADVVMQAIPVACAGGGRWLLTGRWRGVPVFLHSSRNTLSHPPQLSFPRLVNLTTPRIIPAASR